ncbi:MAG TPA: phosphatidylglycerophosphatase A [Terriglobales bacterium]|nr:phosphatidylglycerophosphatase A [Terriglobales bacterium]
METTSDNPVPLPKAPLWAWMVATQLGIGHLRPAPGTWASAATVGLWVALASSLPSELHWPVATGLAVAAVLAGIPAAAAVARERGTDDPQSVVIDEVAGQMVALLALPVAWKSLLVSLILFRVFDIVKPPPLRRLEKLHGGLGIMMDDVAAGLYARLGAELLLRAGWLT